MSEVAFPSWFGAGRKARQRSDEIVAEVSRREQSFEESRIKVLVAATRAEATALAMMERQDQLAADVARQRR